MKGVVLAGGTGSRLDPLTRITNKHLLPVYDRPMVVYAIEALREAGVTEVMLVTGGEHVADFRRLLGDDLVYGNQERPGGIAEALGLAERFVDRGQCVVMLADNVFERSLATVVMSTVNVALVIVVPLTVIDPVIELVRPKAVWLWPNSTSSTR